MELHRSSVELMVIGTSDAQYGLCCCWQQPRQEAKCISDIIINEVIAAQSHTACLCYITSAAEYFFNSAMWSTFFDRRVIRRTQQSVKLLVWCEKMCDLINTSGHSDQNYLEKLCKKVTAAWQEVFSLYDVVSVWHPKKGETVRLSTSTKSSVGVEKEVHSWEKLSI